MSDTQNDFADALVSGRDYDEAVIVPIPESLLADAATPIWDQVARAVIDAHSQRAVDRP